MAGAGTVIVVGAGPTGLALSAELALAGAQVRVLDRRSGLRADSRAICLHARSMEMLDLRGQAGAFTAAGLPVPSFPLGLKGAAINFGRLDSDFPYLLDIPQSQIETLLLDRATSLGTTLRWSCEVTGIEQDDHEVRVRLASGETERADYLVGCDGLRSFVRQAAGLPFPGAPNPGSVLLADLHLDGLPMTDAYGDLSDRGMLLVFPFRDGSCRTVLYDYARAGAEVSEPVTLDEIRTSLIRVTGQDFGPRDMTWSGRYRSESRQVPQYRAGRVLLAGDAAHTHSPAGAQGMNTGLQDAVNLGWKLGATAAGRAPGWLLDSYHDERYPVGRAVLALTGRQFRLNTARTARRRAVRWAAHRMIAPLPPVQDWLAATYSGVAIRYPPDGPAPSRTRPWARCTSWPGRGCRAARWTSPAAAPPGCTACSARAGSRCWKRPARTTARAPLTAPPGVPGPGGAGPGGAGTADLVRRVRYRRCQGARLPAAVLARPDGYIAWASDERDASLRTGQARAAVRAWCGSA